MKTLTSLLLTLCAGLFLVPTALAQDVTPREKAEIHQVIQEIEGFMMVGNADAIISLLSADADQNLASEITEAIAGRKIDFNETITSHSRNTSGNVEVRGTFSAETSSWSLSGLGNQFVFADEDGEWKLLSTNFHEKMDFSGVIGFVLKIWAMIFVPMLILFVFWLWMLIDAIVRPISNKLVWILVIFFFNFLGALVYFFAARRSHKSMIQQQTGEGTSMVEHLVLLLMTLAFFGSIAWGGVSLWNTIKDTGVLTPDKEGTPFAELIEDISPIIEEEIGEAEEVIPSAVDEEKIEAEAPPDTESVEGLQKEFDVIVEGYVSVEQRTTPFYCDVDCDVFDYVNFHFTSEDQQLAAYMELLYGKERGQEYKVGLGCDRDGTFFYQNDSVALGFKDFALSNEFSEAILSSSEQSPIRLRLVALEFFGGFEPPDCYTNVTIIEEVEENQPLPEEGQNEDETAVEERDVILVRAEGVNEKGDRIYLDDDTNVWIEYKNGEVVQLIFNGGTTRGCGNNILRYANPVLSSDSQYALLPLFCEGDPTEIWVKDVATKKSYKITLADQASFSSHHDGEKIRTSDGRIFENPLAIPSTPEEVATLYIKRQGWYPGHERSNDNPYDEEAVIALLSSDLQNIYRENSFFAIGSIGGYDAVFGIKYDSTQFFENIATVKFTGEYYDKAPVNWSFKVVIEDGEWRIEDINDYIKNGGLG